MKRAWGGRGTRKRTGKESPHSARARKEQRVKVLPALTWHFAHKLVQHLSRQSMNASSHFNFSRLLFKVDSNAFFKAAERVTEPAEAYPLGRLLYPWPRAFSEASDDLWHSWECWLPSRGAALVDVIPANLLSREHYFGFLPKRLLWVFLSEVTRELFDR